MKNKNNTFFTYIRDYLTIYLPNQKTASENTIKAYKDSLNLLFDFFNSELGIQTKDICFDQFTAKNLNTFMEWLSTARHCKSSSINLRRTAIRGFAGYAASMDISNLHVQNEAYKMPLQKSKDQKIVGFLSEKGLKSLLAQPDGTKTTEIRNLFFMILMYDTAGRNSELLNIRMRDLREINGKYTVLLHGKAHKERVLPLEDRTAEHLKKYMRHYHDPASIKPEDYLFYIKRKGAIQQMSPDCSAKFIQKYGEMARKECDEIPSRIHPHMLRHSRAMHLYRNGMQLPELQQFLGHNQLETVLVYAYADSEMKRKAIEKATLNGWKGSCDTKSDQYSTDEEIRKLCGLR